MKTPGDPVGRCPVCTLTVPGRPCPGHGGRPCDRHADLIELDAHGHPGHPGEPPGPPGTCIGSRTLVRPVDPAPARGAG